MAHANEMLGFLHGFYGVGATIAPLIATTMITKGDLPWFYWYYAMVSPLFKPNSTPQLTVILDRLRSRRACHGSALFLGSQRRSFSRSKPQDIECRGLSSQRSDAHHASGTHNVDLRSFLPGLCWRGSCSWGLDRGVHDPREKYVSCGLTCFAGLTLY